MRRLASLLVVLALLAATATAFAVSERLKLEKSPIAGPEITKVFSPVCECDSAAATIAFGLRKDDRVSLSVVNADNEIVRRLADDVAASGRFERRWDGRDDEGRLVPDGLYKPRLRLAHGRRTFILLNPMRVDTRPPTITLVAAKPQFFSPDGDGRSDRVRLLYRLSEPANAILLANGAQAGRTRFRPTEGSSTARHDWRPQAAARALPAAALRGGLGREPGCAHEACLRRAELHRARGRIDRAREGPNALRRAGDDGCEALLLAVRGPAGERRARAPGAPRAEGGPLHALRRGERPRRQGPFLSRRARTPAEPLANLNRSLPRAHARARSLSPSGEASSAPHTAFVRVCAARRPRRRRGTRAVRPHPDA